MTMTDYGEWGQKGATLTDTTAQKEYGVSRDFLIKGIREGKLEFRETSMYGNPCIRLLRRQVEQYVAEQLGAKQLRSEQTATELRKIKREINSLKRKLAALE